MRSCARLILLAATISSALVIFCVLLTLAILVRISLVPGMGRSGGEAARGGKVVADLLQRRLVLLEHRLAVDGVQISAITRAREGLQCRLEFHYATAIDLVHVAVID